MTTKLPTEDRPITLDPAIKEQVEGLLKPYSGEKLEKARAAVLKVYKSGFSGTFDALIGRYREAVEEAVA